MKELSSLPFNLVFRSKKSTIQYDSFIHHTNIDSNSKKDYDKALRIRIKIKLIYIDEKLHCSCSYLGNSDREESKLSLQFMICTP